MKVDKVNATSSAETLKEIKKVNNESVIKDSKMYRDVNEYETKVVNAFAKNPSLMNKNLQKEISKLQVARIHLLKENDVFSETKKKLEGMTSIEVANKDILECINRIDEISDTATFENVKLFETGTEYTQGKFRVPSINVGGKNYLHIQNLDISTTAGLNNALATIDKAINKITNEISLCDGTIEFLCDKVDFSRSSFDGSISDINVAKEKMNSLKQVIFREAFACIKVQSSDLINNVVGLLDNE